MTPLVFFRAQLSSPSLATFVSFVSFALIAFVMMTASASARAEAPTPAPQDADYPELPEPPREEASWTDDWSILPVVFYSPETAFGFGFAVIRGLSLPEHNPSVSTVALGVLYTTRSQLIVRLEPDLRFGDSAFVDGTLTYERYPTRFFEPGAHPGDKGELFDEEGVLGHLDARVTLTGRLRAGLRWEYRYNHMNEFVKGGALERSGYDGLETYFASGLGPVISFDSRDEPRLPTRGILIDLRAIGFAGVTGSGFAALRVDLELRGFLDLGNCHVLAGEIHTQMSTGDMPFQILPHLGGPNHLRGWYEGHLRDRHALLGQLEWRFPIVGRVGGAAFFALGEAVPDLAELSLERLRAGGGVGLRYLLNQRQNVTIRLDLAWGSGFGAYFDVLEAF